MRKKDIKRLSDSGFIRKKRIRRLLPHDSRTKRRCAVLAGLLAAEIIVIFSSQWLIREPAHSLVQYVSGSQPLVQERAVIDPYMRKPETLAEPEEAIKAAPPSYEQTIETTLKRGDTLFDILMKEGIPPTQIHQLVESSRPLHDLGRLRQGRKFTLVHDIRDGRILYFETALDEDHLLIVESHGGSLRARKETFEYETRHRVAKGTIRGSLFLAANAAGLPDLLILSLAEIFAWDIDFNVDIHEGDTFRVLFEEKYLDGCFARYGRILAAEIMNRAQGFWAFYFEGSDGRADYYKRDGRSLQKLFLKSPLKYTRISSRFSRRRLHPILKIYRPHLGVDYAAPTGTPVHAIGDGRVDYVGWNGGYGRYVTIRHNATYRSTYGHLHRYARRLRKGRYVRQGQVIGYVGSTGLSTGPHLDFRLLKNGGFVDPLKVNLPNADPVRQEDRAAFLQVVDHRMAEVGGVGSVLTRAAGPTRP